MNILEALTVSGYIGKAIIIPILRFIASVFFAVAISRDCKNRTNASSTLWGIVTLIFPALSGIVYFIYSRFLVEKSPESQRNQKIDKSSKVFFALAVITYAIMITAFIIFTIVSVSSSVAQAVK